MVLSFIQISSLPENAFQYLKELKVIFIFENQLKSLSAQLFKNLKLVTIGLDANKIVTNSLNSFVDLINLEELYLQTNQIATLRSILFKKLSKLKGIYWNENNLKVLPREVFKLNKKLEKLGLETNQLEKIDEALFDDLKNLKWIDLRENKCIEEFGDFELKSNLNFLQ